MDNERERRIKELRAELRAVRAEMKELGIKRTSCFNRIGCAQTYRYNAEVFRLETLLKSLVSA